jgi:hypothetical protein
VVRKRRQKNESRILILSRNIGILSFSLILLLLFTLDPLLGDLNSLSSGNDGRLFILHDANLEDPVLHVRLWLGLEIAKLGQGKGSAKGAKGAFRDPTELVFKLFFMGPFATHSQQLFLLVQVDLDVLLFKSWDVHVEDYFLWGSMNWGREEGS